MMVAVFLGKDSTKPSAVYRVVAGSPHEAAKLMSQYLGERDPWVPIDVVEIANDGVKGPARVLGPIDEGHSKPESPNDAQTEGKGLP